MSAGGWEAGESDLHRSEREEMSRKDPEPGQTESEKSENFLKRKKRMDG